MRGSLIICNSVIVSSIKNSFPITDSHSLLVVQDRHMSPTSVAFVFTLSMSILSFECIESRKVSRDNVFPSPVGCLNCTICQYPCQPLTPPPPPLPDYPVYASPPPPPQLPGYPVYGAQPPPSSIPGYPMYRSPPSSPSQVNCTQFPVQCCQNPPPQPFAYQPYENFSAPCSSLHITSVIALILCIIALLL